MTALERVQQNEERLATVGADIDKLTAEEAVLTAEISAGLVAGKDVLKQQARRREVRDSLQDLREASKRLEQQLAAEREAAGIEAAIGRMKGIARAFGSVREELEQDEAKLQDAALGFKEAADRVNNRFKSLALLKAEASALTDRFGVEAPDLAPVTPPAMREGCGKATETVSVRFLDSGFVRVATEEDDSGLRTRRTYAEVRHTPAGEIIKAADLKPWPPLTKKQEAMIAAGERAEADEAAFSERAEVDAARAVRRTGL